MSFKLKNASFLKNLLLKGGGLFVCLWIAVAQASTGPSDQFLQGLSSSNKNFSAPGEGHTISFTERFNTPWLKEFNNNIINGDKVPAALREKGQAMLDKVEELDKRCAATGNAGGKEACLQQRDVALAQIEKMVADNNPDLKNLISQAASQAGDFSSEFDPSNLVSQFDDMFAQMGNLKDMLGSMGSLPTTPTKEALSIPRPSASGSDITQQLNLGDNLAHKRISEIENVSIRPEQSDGFFDKIKNFWQELKPGVQQALTIQAWAQSPFSTLGQSGQSQLRVITTSRETESFDRESKAVNDERDRRVTKNNDIAGQGKSALQERAEKILEVMNDTTKEQDKALQSLQHICQNQRASIPCWESGNEIPFDLLAMLMGATGGGGEAPTAPELEPYQAWLHCPLPGQPFTRTAEGRTITALFLQERTRQLLTLESALPPDFHRDGCIVGLPGEDSFEYFSAKVEPEIIDRETQVEADLALLKIDTVHTELGEDLGDPEAAFDDFVTDYWPDWDAGCQTDAVFRIGDELQLLGFQLLEEEAEDPEAVTTLNGLANFVADENGATRFTTNGEESFNGGSVARTTNGCFKGLAKVEVNQSDGSNKQSLVPVSLIQTWLQTQNIVLPTQSTEAER